MKQMSFSAARFDRYSNATQRAAAFFKMDRVMQVPTLRAQINRALSKAEKGHPQVSFESMSHIKMPQNLLDLFENATEQAFNDSRRMSELLAVVLNQNGPQNSTEDKFNNRSRLP